MSIVQATDADIPTVREMFQEYAAWVEVSLCFQNFDRELAELPGDYVPPTGRLLIARIENEIAGCIALRSIGDDICEMKRLYVRPTFRNLGLGRQLTDRVIAEARAIGYKKMRLDTLPGKMDRAIAMYRALGFQEMPRYYDNPHDAAMFMELIL